MPATLRRRHRQELTLRKSFLEAVQSKWPSSIFRRPSNKSAKPPLSVDARVDNPPHDHYRQQFQRSTAAPFFWSSHSIRQLPPEILAYIFILGSEVDSMLPVAVSHVCSYWRDLALRTPRLWRRITLGSHHRMLRERIYRARACTLDVVLLSGASLHRSLGFYEVQRYMHLVAPFIRYWRSLDISIMNYSPYLWNAALSECCSGSNRTQAPELEELSLVYRRNDDTKEFCLFSGYTPRLRRVTVDGIRLTWLRSLFANLTFLDYTHHGITSGTQALHEVISNLHISSRLEELRISFPGKKPGARTSSRVSPIVGRVQLLVLKTLQLRVDTEDIPSELIHFASVLFTPALTVLQLVDAGSQRCVFSSLPTFMTLYIFPPPLKVLYIQNGWYSEEVVARIRDRIPHLHHLVVQRPNTYFG